jgi:type IV pilus assembly protein PilF
MAIVWRLVALCLSLLAAGCFAFGPDAEDVKMATAEYGLANEAFSRGKYREALDHVEKALGHDDHNAEAAYLGAVVMLAFCAMDENSPDCRYEAAEQFARQALAADPEMRDARNALGVVLVHRGQAAEAVTVLEPLAKDILYRSPEKAWGNLGWAYLEAGRLDKAVTALKRAVASQPLFCVGHYRLGLTYEKKRDYAAARQAFTRAVGITEGGCGRLQDAFAARARVQERLGLRAEVRKDLQKCRELSAGSNVGRECSRRLGSTTSN